MDYSVESIVWNIENGMSIEFYLLEIENTVNESARLLASDEIFKKIKPSWLPGKMIKMYKEIEKSSNTIIPRTIKRNNEKIELITAGILEYAKKHCSEEETVNIKEKIERAKKNDSKTID